MKLVVKGDKKHRFTDSDGGTYEVRRFELADGTQVSVTRSGESSYYLPAGEYLVETRVVPGTGSTRIFLKGTNVGTAYNYTLGWAGEGWADWEIALIGDDGKRILGEEGEFTLAKYRERYKAGLNEQGVANYLHLRSQLKDGEIIGLDEDGTIVQWDATNGQEYNSGETPAQFGIHQLTDIERKRVGLPG